MILLFLALQFKILEFRHVDEAGSFLINNMTILFLPAGVGIMAKWNLISHFWAQILLIVVGALIINMLILGKLVEWIKVKFEGELKSRIRSVVPSGKRLEYVVVYENETQVIKLKNALSEGSQRGNSNTKTKSDTPVATPANAATSGDAQ